MTFLLLTKIFLQQHSRLSNGRAKLPRIGPFQPLPVAAPALQCYVERAMADLDLKKNSNVIYLKNFAITPSLRSIHAS